MNLSMDPQLHKKNNIYFLSIKTIRILPLILSCQAEIQSDSLFGFNPSGLILSESCALPKNWSRPLWFSGSGQYRLLLRGSLFLSALLLTVQ